MMRLQLGLILILAMTECSGSSSDEPGQSKPPAYNQSPIVYGSYDPPGTFFSTVDDPTPRHLNDVYDYFPISVSPSRARVFQATTDLGIQVHELAEDGAPLSSFESPGQLLGWDGEDTLLFATSRTGGLTRVALDSGARDDFAFPAWVMRDSNGPLSYTLSPDAKAAAFVVLTADESVVPIGFAVLVLDTRDGSLLATWPVDDDVSPGHVIWAKDGTIVFYSLTSPMIMTVSIGDSSFSEPITVPFQPCDADPWVTPGVLHMTESVSHGDFASCGNSWLIETSGSNPTRRDAERPVAISPDSKKILLLGPIGELIVADPDGSAQTQLPGLPQAHGAAW